MASYQIEVTEEAKGDLSSYTAFERKIIVSEIREQLTYQPHGKLRTVNLCATIRLRPGNYA